MNKHDLAQKLRKKHGMSWREANNVLETVFGSIRKELYNGNKFVFHNFGSFRVIKFGTKSYKDMRTGQRRISVVKNKVKFTPSKRILEL